MHEREDDAVVVSHVRGTRGAGVVSLFKQAFPRHPASLLGDALTSAFLHAFARSGTFLVAHDPRTDEELGFAIGGDAAVLDRMRGRFIRRHGWRIAGSLLRGRLSARLLAARIRVRRPLNGAHNAPYQLRFIAVDPSAKGRGIGTLLLDAFERTLPPGAAYHAWTLEGPHGAEGFYIARGFCRDVTMDGSVRLWKRL